MGAYSNATNAIFQQGQSIQSNWIVEDNNTFSFGNDSDYKFVFDSVTGYFRIVDPSNNVLFELNDEGSIGSLKVGMISIQDNTTEKFRFYEESGSDTNLILQNQKTDTHTTLKIQPNNTTGGQAYLVLVPDPSDTYLFQLRTYSSKHTITMGVISNKTKDLEFITYSTLSSAIDTFFRLSKDGDFVQLYDDVNLTFGSGGSGVDADLHWNSLGSFEFNIGGSTMLSLTSSGVVFGSNKLVSDITPAADNTYRLGNTTRRYQYIYAKDGVISDAFWVVDGVTAPSATSGWAKIYVDSADGDLKVIFGDGVIKTIVTDI